MNKRSVIFVLCLSLVLLVLAYIFRYDTLASKTTDGAVIKWYRDVWTGTNWTVIYTVSNIREYPSNIRLPERIITAEDIKLQKEVDIIKAKADTATTIWKFIFATNIILLIYTVLKRPKIKAEEAS